jgi:Rrf2 family protein
MGWPLFPKRLQSALKALCCLARAGSALQAQTISEAIGVPKAETAKIMQLLVWGGFVVSRRGTKGGFHLAASPDSITMGKVIDFFLSRHPETTEDHFPVIRALQQALAPCEQKFAELTLANVTDFPGCTATSQRVRNLRPGSRKTNVRKGVVASR